MMMMIFWRIVLFAYNVARMFETGSPPWWIS